MLVARGGDIVVDRNYGHTTKGGPKVDGSTVYDLASVSKAIGTLPGVMKAYDLGLFSLDAPASRIIPGLRVEAKADITPRQLLHHDLHTTLSGRTTLVLDNGDTQRIFCKFCSADALNLSCGICTDAPRCRHPVILRSICVRRFSAAQFS